MEKDEFVVTLPYIERLLVKCVPKMDKDSANNEPEPDTAPSTTEFIAIEIELLTEFPLQDNPLLT